jgi:AraC-like DNA-binding protein
MPLDIVLKPVETIVFRSDVVALGTFRCRSTDPLFRDSGPCTHHTFVFPRTSTIIRHSGGAPFTATPNCVTLYNQHQNYTRSAISSVDASDWFVMADDVLASCVDLDGARPFRATHIPIDGPTYLMQRRLFDAARTLDLLEVEERALHIWSRVASALGRTRRRKELRDRERIEEAKRIVATEPARRISLREIAAKTQLSPFQLCRAFRDATGMTLTAYRHDLRLRIALDLLRDPRADLSDIGLRLGYANHSHFTATFRRRFGITPSQYRQDRDSAAARAFVAWSA